jgi:L-ascorbate metabolism protein UlaG (beta-lactamase superfamily)
MRLNDKHLLTDPCMNSLTGVNRLVPNPYPFEEIPQLDYVLFSHTHRDHFDLASFKVLLKVHPDVHFLVPLKMTPLLKKLGKNNTETSWFQ